METRTDGRIYVEVGGNDLVRIVQFDSVNKRNKVIERDKRTNRWHVHYGYLHSEYDETIHHDVTGQDKALLDSVIRLWENKRRA